VKAVNLIPSEQRRARPTGSRSGGAYVICGVLGALVLMVAGYVLVGNKANESKTRAAAAQQEADRLEAQTQQLGSYTDFAAIKDTRLASVQGVASTRFDWERLMRELALVMPEGSWLQSANASVTGVGDEGAASASAAAAANAAPAEPALKLVGCTPRQSEVASMMVRLRELHRVTDVALNESAQEQTGEDASLSGCGSLYKFDITVTFGAVASSGEAPRGAARVPASLGGGS
jgi:Tfp pilus assembly protein PilN